MELKTACDKAGIKFGLYYSIIDWNHSSQTINGDFTKMKSMAARTAYIRDMKAQLKELVDRYDPAIMWFDGDWTYSRKAPTLAKWWTKADGKLAAKVEPLEQVIDRIRDKLKEAHVKRLTNGECTIELGFIFSDLITSMERVSDHCSNIAVGVIEINNNGYDAHEYLHELKNSDDIQYNADYKEYKKKYALPAAALKK